MYAVRCVVPQLVARAGEGTSAADKSTAAGAADAAFGDSSSSESEDEGPQGASAAAAAAAADEREAAKAWILQQYAADGSDSGSEAGAEKAPSEVSIRACTACGMLQGYCRPWAHV